eukprot:c20749_g1_i4.p1 GENE.c20749_g1_i4~~c20749_g1_i4.p1  ORF type:complete len:148 (+),score=38.70 c20749_g1_i4:33-446(+)
MDKEELKDAILNGDVGGVRRILRNTPALANQRLEKGWTAMLWAADKGECEVMKVLREFGSAVNDIGDVGFKQMHNKFHFRIFIDSFVGNGIEVQSLSNANEKNQTTNFNFKSNIETPLIFLLLLLLRIGMGEILNVV